MLAGIYSAFQHWGNQTVWIYSDPHFGDKDLECGIVNRPSDEEQIKMINSCVGRKDTLIILGDVGDIECVKKLRGYKVLIMGNHDAGATNYKRKIDIKIFDMEKYTREAALEEARKIYPNCKLEIREGYDICHAPFCYWAVTADNCLFDEVYEGALIVGEKLIFSHEPVEIPWLFNIHGHDHAGKVRDGHLNVCSDVIGYKPMNLNGLLKKGPAAKVQSIHRLTIDNATKRKAKRGGQKLGRRKA
jgi:calcineurin-like phosphoesterase family protein